MAHDYTLALRAPACQPIADLPHANFTCENAVDNEFNIRQTDFLIEKRCRQFALQLASCDNIVSTVVVCSLRRLNDQSTRHRSQADYPLRISLEFCAMYDCLQSVSPINEQCVEVYKYPFHTRVILGLRTPQIFFKTVIFKRMIKLFHNIQ